MKPAAFAYHAPRTVDEAVTLLATLAPEGGRILAGGQSLIPMMAFRMAQPAHLIDIGRIADLDKIHVVAGRLTIGAATRHAAFERPAAPGPLGALLARVCTHIAHGPIRARGTFGGSLAHADPASEWCLLATTLDATITARSQRGARLLDAANFFQGALTTSLAEDELLTAIALNLLPDDTRVGFAEFSRRQGDFAMATALASYRLDAGHIAEPRLGIGGVETIARRIPEAEDALRGAAPSPALFAAIADIVRGAVNPMEDKQIPTAYRRDLAAAMTRRALAQCAAP